VTVTHPYGDERGTSKLGHDRGQKGFVCIREGVAMVREKKMM
jgi:hypothetical protein